MMKLYHSSDLPVERPDTAHSRPYHDSWLCNNAKIEIFYPCHIEIIEKVVAGAIFSEMEP